MKSTTLVLPAFFATAAVAAAPGMVKVVNRCSYDVTLWNVNKDEGCSKEKSFVLKKGVAWTQQMLNPDNPDDGGISIKISKFSTCGGKDLTQLEYKIIGPPGNVTGNFLDMSFVDCQINGDCPGYKDGYYLKSGNNGEAILASAVNNEHCPIFSVANEAEAAKVAYVLPHDRQTKWCYGVADLELYLCGAQAPSAGDATSTISVPASTASTAPTSTALSSTAPSSIAPTTTAKVPTTTSKASSADLGIAKAAAVTEAPEPQVQAPKAVKTVIEYVTVSVDAPVRRHTHGRRHQRIHA